MDKLAIPPDLEAAVNRRRFIDQMPSRDRRFISVVVDLMRGEYLATSPQEVEAV